MMVLYLPVAVDTGYIRATVNVAENLDYGTVSG